MTQLFIETRSPADRDIQQTDHDIQQTDHDIQQTDHDIQQTDHDIQQTDRDIQQTDIHKLTDWSNKWQMEFNTSKCHLLTITQKSKPSQFTYTISNQPISQINSNPYLGIIIDSKLSWTKHVRTTASKSAQTLGLLKRMLHPAKPKVKEAAYNMSIRPKLGYVATAWNPHAQNNIDTLEKIQRSAA